MANLDALLATSVTVIINYIGKYYSKEGKKSASYEELFKMVTLYTNKLYAFNSIITKFVNKLIGK